MILLKYFYYNSNTGETTWALPVHRYVGHAASSLATSSTTSANLQQKKIPKKSIDGGRSKVEPGLQPMTLVGDILSFIFFIFLLFFYFLFYYNLFQFKIHSILKLVNLICK